MRETSDDSLPLAIQAEQQNPDFLHQWWIERHQEKCLEVSQRGQSVELVFLGDSITHAWEDFGASQWEAHFAPLQALNLGYTGDRTENVLWSIQHGELSGLSPKLLVLLIGTNNIGHRQDPPEDTALGVKAILEAIQHALPGCKILLLSIFPRGKTSQDKLRLLVNHANDKIKHFADEKRIFWLDLTHCFVSPNGDISTSVMEDYLHPNPEQYQVWAEAMLPTIDVLMG